MSTAQPQKRKSPTAPTVGAYPKASNTSFNAGRNAAGQESAEQAEDRLRTRIRALGIESKLWRGNVRNSPEKALADARATLDNAVINYGLVEHQTAEARNAALEKIDVLADIVERMESEVRR